MAKPAWMQIGEIFLGESEIPGAFHNRKIVEMFRLIEHPEMDRDEIPWCAAFVGACLSLSGFSNSKSALARSYELFGEDLGETPRLGCLAVFSRGEVSSGQGHVGFYAGTRGDKILVLGGNQSDTVSLVSYPKVRLIAYRWPSAYASLPKTFLPSIMDINPADAPEHLVEKEVPAERLERSSYSSSFLKCHEVIARWEGGYVNHAQDPGGATNFGITEKTLSAWRGRSVSKQDVKDLAYEEALDIFFARYWSVLRGDGLPIAVALMAYNAGVNSGPSRSARFLQKALRAQGLDVSVDGDIGPETIAAVKRADVLLLLNSFSEIYGDFYSGLSTFGTFGRGWMNRLKNVTSVAVEWADVKDIANQAADRDAEDDDLTSFDKITGGRKLAGKKTIIAVVVYFVLVIAEAFDLLPQGFVQDNIVSAKDLVSGGDGQGSVLPPSSVSPSSEGVSALDIVKQVLLGFGGLSALSKLERGLKVVRRI